MERPLEKVAFHVRGHHTTGFKLGGHTGKPPRVKTIFARREAGRSQLLFEISTHGLAVHQRPSNGEMASSFMVSSPRGQIFFFVTSHHFFVGLASSKEGRSGTEQQGGAMLNIVFLLDRENIALRVWTASLRPRQDFAKPRFPRLGWADVPGPRHGGNRQMRAERHGRQLPDQRPRTFGHRQAAQPTQGDKGPRKGESGQTSPTTPPPRPHQMHVPKSRLLVQAKGAGDSNQPHHRRPGSPTDDPR